MKYRHIFHAGNFADVHKHVTLVALIEALQRKPKGILFVDTHAGAGRYAIPSQGGEACTGLGRMWPAPAASAPSTGHAEIDAWLALVAAERAQEAGRSLYPGSPLIAARLLRAQDRGIAIERSASEVRLLRQALPSGTRMRVEEGDGFERLRALLPPPERRGLVLVDPPYEETARDFAHVATALEDALRRFATGVFVAWYPIKLASDATAWQARLDARIARPLLHSELRLYPPDSRASLNGSGIAVVNPPHRLAERMRVWLPALYERLAVGAGGGWSVREHSGHSGDPAAPV